MKWFNTLPLIAAWLLHAPHLAAQVHYNAWMRGTLDMAVSPKIKTDLELQHRRQNGFQNGNMFDQRLMLSFRSWMYYQISPDFTCSFSPFAYFHNYPVLISAADRGAAGSGEIRISVAAEWRHRVTERFSFADRTAFEYRVFLNERPAVSRLRIRLGGRYACTPQLGWVVFNEFLFNVSGASKDHIADQNRAGMGLEYHPAATLKLEAGYIYLVRFAFPDASGSDLLYENNLFLSLTCQIRSFRCKSSCAAD